MSRAFATTLATLVLALGASAPAVTQNAPASANPGRTGLTTVAGLRVGHHTLTERPTGCTVVLVDGDGAVGGVSQRGGAPGTSETDLLAPLNLVDKVNAVVLSGGSAYGLDARQGVVRYLEERKIGWNVGAAGVVPIVPAAILFDLGFGGDGRIRPTADCGYKAAAAASNGAVAEGNVGAGAGATVGKMGGAGKAMKGGIGTAHVMLPNGLAVAALAAVNAVGDIVDPLSGQIVAGVRTPDGKTLADARALLRSGSVGGNAGVRPAANTTIAVVATNARMTKVDINRVALMADDGLARAIRPSHTTSDGDTVFALATGRWQGQTSPTVVGALAADVLAEAVVRAVVQARAAGGLPAARDLGTVPARFR
jgi:L-aminopeptidase/D-esterase-like protein